MAATGYNQFGQPMQQPMMAPGQFPVAPGYVAGQPLAPAFAGSSTSLAYFPPGMQPMQPMQQPMPLVNPNQYWFMGGQQAQFQYGVGPNG